MKNQLKQKMSRLNANSIHTQSEATLWQFLSSLLTPSSLASLLSFSKLSSNWLGC